MLFRRKKVHQEEVDALKKTIKRSFDKATASVKLNKETLEANGISLEIKRAIGGHHA